MAMAARAIDDDPQLAHEHAQAAMRHAGRVAVARETLAVTAYATGDFALALRELRTVRRITGRNDHVAMIVDSERGVGRADKALEEGRAADRASLEVSQRVELAIAMSGARLDLGQTELALHELDIPEDDPNRAFEWSAGLFAARAAVLEDLGRTDEADEWARRASIAEDAILSKLAEDDTVEIHEIEFDAPGSVDGADADEPVDAVDEARPVGSGDESVGAEQRDGAADDSDGVAVDAASADADADGSLAESDAELGAADSAEPVDVAEESAAPEAAGSPTDAPEPEAQDVEVPADAPAVDDMSIEDEVAEILADAGIVDDNAADVVASDVDAVDGDASEGAAESEDVASEDVASEGAASEGVSSEVDGSGVTEPESADPADDDAADGDGADAAGTTTDQGNASDEEDRPDGALF
ncbi:hypothetical protein [Microbacterium sp. ZXX196]|uniref:hypothetical protein n=1 Tax=Microbacterium sp. ZXX196 TaxID=2609291 RepID=UPI0012B8A458|nr:hypothetical protein [Microbacterium sp. ZXX196]MTE23189.1 hypothetical protein [Microbacterium sp. ZXX196]